MLFFEFYECVYSSDFKNVNQFVLKKSRCHRRQIIYKKQDIYVGFGLVSAAVFTVHISLFSRIGSWEALMGTQWERNILCVVLDTVIHQSAGGAHGANSVSCISQCQIVRLGNRPKSGMVNQ